MTRLIDNRHARLLQIRMAVAAMMTMMVTSAVKVQLMIMQGLTAVFVIMIIKAAMLRLSR